MSDKEGKKVVLAIDDAPENLDVVKSILTPQYIVKAAINGMMALKIVEKQAPDIILLDIMMPGIDGYEVCRRLKAAEATADIPVIFLTGESDAASVESGLALGAVGYITKPIDPDALKNKIGDCLS